MSGGLAKNPRRSPHRHTDALAQVAQAVARVGTPEEWGLRVVTAVAHATGWSRVFIFRLAGSQLRLVAAHGITPEQERESQTLALDGPSLSAQAVQRGQPLVFRRADIGEASLVNVRRLALARYAVFPLIARGRVFGSLTLLDARKTAVSDAEVAFLQAVADTTATGLESTELYATVETASREKDNFLTVASHELRTPLTPLKGLTQLMLRNMERARETGQPVDLARVERYLRSMDGQVTRLAGLVNDPLDVSRLRTGRLKLRLEETDLAALTATVLERFEATEHHTFRFTPPAQPVVGRWDAARLEQVVTNLVTNAIKYTPSGGEVHVAVGPAHGKDQWAHIGVRDSGIGIPSGQIEELFRPFHRLTNAPAEHFGGLGLGLYISHDIVERHGGRIWAESPGPGEGTSFHVMLPLSPPEEFPSP